MPPLCSNETHKIQESLSDSTNQIPTSGSEGDSMREMKDGGFMREVKEKKKRSFTIKKHKVGDKIQSGMLVDSGVDAHMVPEGMFDIPINEEKAHKFETADGTEMPSPGTQYIPGYMGPNYDIPFTVECYVADVDGIILSPGLLRKKGVSFSMEPERSFIKLLSGPEISLVNGEKETVYLEAKLSKSHPAFKPTQNQKPAQKQGETKQKGKPKTKNNTGNEPFHRQGRKR